MTARGCGSAAAALSASRPERVLFRSCTRRGQTPTARPWSVRASRRRWTAPRRSAGGGAAAVASAVCGIPSRSPTPLPLLLDCASLDCMGVEYVSLDYVDADCVNIGCVGIDCVNIDCASAAGVFSPRPPPLRQGRSDRRCGTLRLHVPGARRRPRARRGHAVLRPLVSDVPAATRTPLGRTLRPRCPRNVWRLRPQCSLSAWWLALGSSCSVAALLRLPVSLCVRCRGACPPHARHVTCVSSPWAVCRAGLFL